MAAIETAVDALPDVSILRGKEAINLLPRDCGNKGMALAQARDIFACHHAIYVGGEETDEAAFATGGDIFLRTLLEFRRGALNPS